jgi:hypothetical protein
MGISAESWEQYRQRMLEETSRFIEWGLRHPELVTWIPAKPADQGGFPRRVADWFWAAVLSPRPEGAWKTWRERLLLRARFFPARA